MPTLSGHFTCDNVFSVWVGDRCTVEEKIVEGAALSTAAEIVKGVEVPPFPVDRECFIYLLGSSDGKVQQGLVGTFTGAITLHTGDPRWRVLATNRSVAAHQATAAEINEAMRWAGCPGRTDWTTPFVGPPNDGSPPFGVVGMGKIGPEARWMWHDSGKDTRAKWPSSPYVPFTVPHAGFRHDEFLIFRIPCGELFPDGVWGYSVKFVCGRALRNEALARGQYRTEINIHNYGDREAHLEKHILPTILKGRALGREPRQQGVKAEDTMTLRPHSVTMDDCCRIGQLLYGKEVACTELPLTVGFLEIVSDAPLDVTAVYTTAGAAETAIDVETVPGIQRWRPDPDASEPGSECRDCRGSDQIEPGPR